MKLLWTEKAKHDLQEQCFYIVLDNPKAAARVARRVREKALKLPEMPRLGPAGRVLGTRELLINNYPLKIIYKVRDDAVLIVRVIHTARDWP